MITGVLDSLERDEAEDLIRKYGGRTVNTVSSKVNYIIVGDEAGPAKLTKVSFIGLHTHTLTFVFRLYEISFQANSLGLKQISEDDLLEMIRTRPKGKAESIKPIKAKSIVGKTSNKSKSDKSPSPNKIKASPKKIKTSPSSPVKTRTSPISKQTSDTNSSTQKVNLSINLRTHII